MYSGLSHLINNLLSLLPLKLFSSLFFCSTSVHTSAPWPAWMTWSKWLLRRSCPKAKLNSIFFFVSALSDFQLNLSLFLSLLFFCLKAKKNCYFLHAIFSISGLFPTIILFGSILFSWLTVLGQLSIVRHGTGCIVTDRTPTSLICNRRRH